MDTNDDLWAGLSDIENDPLPNDDTTAETMLDTDLGSHASLGASHQNLQGTSVDCSTGTESDTDTQVESVDQTPDPPQPLQPRRSTAPKRLIDELQDSPEPPTRRPRIPHSVPYSHCINVCEDNTITVSRLKKIQRLCEDLGKLLYEPGMSQDDLRREWQLQVKNPADESTYLRILIVLPDLTGQQPLGTTLEDVIREEGDEEEEDDDE